MKNPTFPAAELLESRIAPAITVLHPIPDIVPAIGQTGATLDLGDALDAAGSFRTHVRFTTSYVDPSNPAQPQIIDLELFDDKAPVTVANFLRYVNGLAPDDFDSVFFHRAVPGFVLQGGGFATGNPSQHIGIDPVMHNEFTAGDAERSNLAGTISMAKTGLGPNTASSEWFVNLGDNSDNLDNQNGGFTVFGKITQGMNVVNAIAALTTYNFSGATDTQAGGNEPALGSIHPALNDLPLQNYTPGPLPNAANFVTITDAAVIAPSAANAGGATFSLAAINDAIFQVPTDLVTASVSGQSLQLHYKPGASGVAQVVVKISKAGETDVFEDFLVVLRPNLIAGVAADTFAGTIVPGDTGSVTVKVTNSGAAKLQGRFDVTYYLSKVSQNDPLGSVLSVGDDIAIGSLPDQKINLKSGGSVNLTGAAAMPPSLLFEQGADYRILALVQTHAGANVPELFFDDNVAFDGPTHRLFNAAGSFLGRTNAVMKYLDPDNRLVTVKVTGPGFAQFDPQGDGSLLSVLVNETTSASTLSIHPGRGASHTPLSKILLATPLGSAALGKVDLAGDFIAQAGLGKLALGNVGDGLASRIMSIAASSNPLQKATVTLGIVRDVAFNSAMPLASLTAVDWLDSDASSETVSAVAIESLKIAGDSKHKGAFQADLLIFGTGKVKSFIVTGAVSNAKIAIRGNVGSVNVGALLNSDFFAGLTNVPAQLSDFAAEPRKIDSFIIRDTNPAGPGLVNSHIAASRFGSIDVRNIDPASGTGDFGFIADRIASYQHGSRHLSGLGAAGGFDRSGNYVVRVL